MRVWLVPRAIGALSLVALASCSDLGGCAKAPPAQSPEPLSPSIGRAVLVEGAAHIERDGAPRRALILEALFPRDLLLIEADSRAVLRGAGGELELGPHTHLRLGRSLQQVDVGVGAISFLADGDAGLVVLTPFGRATLSSGSRARIETEDGGLSLVAGFGGVEFIDPEGRPTPVLAGQRLRVGLGSVAFDDPPELAPADGGAAEVRATAERGVPLLRPPHAPQFVPATREGEIAADGTAFKVPPGAALRLDVEGLSVRLLAGSAGLLDGAAASEGVSTLKVALPASIAELRFTSAASLAVDDQTHPLQVRGAPETLAQLSTKGALRRVTVTVGEILLKVGDGPDTVLRPSQVATVGRDGLKLTPRAPPPVVLPYGRSARVLASASGNVGLALPPGFEGRVEVASDGAFRDVLLAGRARDYVLVPAPAGGQLFWRVIADASTGDGGVVTSTARFLPDATAASNNAARSDVVAETGQKATVFYQGSVPTLTFTFPAQEGARGYLFRVYREGALKAHLLERRATENKVVIEAGLLPEGQYLWYASPLDEAGRERAGGRMNRVHIVFDNSLTTLRIASPQEGASAGGGVTAAGVAPLSTRLFINGKAVSLDAGGRFSVQLGRVSLVVFRLIGRDDAETFWVRTLRK